MQKYIIAGIIFFLGFSIIVRYFTIIEGITVNPKSGFGFQVWYLEIWKKRE